MCSEDRGGVGVGGGLDKVQFLLHQQLSPIGHFAGSGSGNWQVRPLIWIGIRVD